MVHENVTPLLLPYNRMKIQMYVWRSEEYTVLLLATHFSYSEIGLLGMWNNEGWYNVAFYSRKEKPKFPLFLHHESCGVGYFGIGGVSTFTLAPTLYQTFNFTNYTMHSKYWANDWGKGYKHFRCSKGHKKTLSANWLVETSQIAMKFME